MFLPLQGIIFRGIISGAQRQKIVPERLFMFFKPGVRKYREPDRRATAFSSVATSMFGSWAWKLLCGTFLALIILIWLLDF